MKNHPEIDVTFVDAAHIEEFSTSITMKLDKEQKRVLKAVLPVSLGFAFFSPLFYWMFGKLDSWTDK